MIVWISGAYGVGKSTFAEALVDKVDHAVIFDAEKVGDAVRENYSDEPYGVIYEDYPLWCEFTYMLLKDIHNVFHRNVLVPMTLIRRESYDKIIQRLLDDGIDTKLIVLTGTYQCIHDRILARGEEEGCWCMENIGMCLEVQQNDSRAVHIHTVGKSPEEIVEEILAVE